MEVEREGLTSSVGGRGKEVEESTCDSIATCCLTCGVHTTSC
jgi:hypothetical protein